MSFHSSSKMFSTFHLFILLLSLVVTIHCDDEPNESDGIHLSDLINQLQGRPYMTYHRVGNDRTYYYHSGPNDQSGSVAGGNGYNYGNYGYGSTYYGYSHINQIPRQEGYNNVYNNGQWQTAYQTECRGRIYDYVGYTPRYYCDCGTAGSSYQMGGCNAPQGK